MNVHNNIIYKHVLNLIRDNTDLPITKQSRLIEVSMSHIAMILCGMGVKIDLDLKRIIWPGGHVCSKENDPLTSKRNRGRPLKKSIDTLMTQTFMQCCRDCWMY